MVDRQSARGTRAASVCYIRLVARGLSGQERGGPARRRAAHAFVALMEPANHGHAALACRRTRAVDGVVVLKRPVGWIVICRRCVRETSRAIQGGARAGELVPFEMQTRVRL